MISDLTGERGASADGVPQAATKLLPHLLEDQPISDPKLQLAKHAHRLAERLVCGRRDRVANEGLNDAGLGGNLLVHCVVDPVEDSRNGEQNGRLDVGQVPEEVGDLVVDGDRSRRRACRAQPFDP